MPATRMGNIAYDRQVWSDAVNYKRKWDDYTTRRAKAGTAKPTDAPRREIANDTLMGVLNGEILVENHCYRADEMANVIAMSHEFGYKVAAFHHAVESYKIADLLAKEGICSAMWADWYGFKMESYDGIRENMSRSSTMPGRVPSSTATIRTVSSGSTRRRPRRWQRGGAPG